MKRSFSLLFLIVLFITSSNAAEAVSFDDVDSFFADKSLLRLSVLMDKLGVKKPEIETTVFSSGEEKSWYYRDCCKTHYSEDKNLLVFEMSSTPMQWEKVFVIFERKDTKYILQDCVESYGKYKKSEFSYWPTKTNIPIFSTTGNWGGTGTQTSVITFYQYKNSKARKVLDFVTYDECGPTYLSHEYSGNISFSDEEIKVGYNISISSIAGVTDSMYKDRPYNIQILKTTKQNIFKWNASEQKYVYNIVSSQLPEKFEKQVSVVPMFYKCFKSEITDIKKSGDKYQREWVEKLLKDIPEQDK
ncbi:MAG: hypothetical protein A2231_08010 [Candidatus Firestonebacteria bacterium RIFOXYA2_FULL_40_8]|nr:MAG: hypothetical protein A2300_01345 [Candidatus Falkowbacteria bacterium RIFOXYB2_FULL_35_7]OGF50673.1 MAG: hypothetical protein A2231_08010 [Candidatus Firestonebacteria bacterium RIFOXYA2_FULL_40_8]